MGFFLCYLDQANCVVCVLNSFDEVYPILQSTLQSHLHLFDMHRRFLSKFIKKRPDSDRRMSDFLFGFFLLFFTLP